MLALYCDLCIPCQVAFAEYVQNFVVVFYSSHKVDQLSFHAVIPIKEWIGGVDRNKHCARKCLCCCDMCTAGKSSVLLLSVILLLSKKEQFNSQFFGSHNATILQGEGRSD